MRSQRPEQSHLELLRAAHGRDRMDTWVPCECWAALGMRQSTPRCYWVYPRSQDRWVNFVTDIWNEAEWLCHFRMSQKTFAEHMDVLEP